MYNEKIKYAVIGAGNGGQAVAGYLGYLGHEVRLYDAIEDTINKINAKGGIELEGETNGFGKLTLVTNDIEKAIDGADLIMVINPSIYHREIAQKCAPYITENQIIFLHPGATFGAFAFKKALQDYGCNLNIPIAESNTLIYACRSTEPGKVHIGGRKDRLLVATLPAKDNDIVCSILREAYPQVENARNVLVTSIDNTNPMLHPGPTLLSTSWIESGKDFLYYLEGVSSSIGKFVMKMDKERMELGKALGLIPGIDMIDAIKQYEVEYNVKGDDLSDVVKRVEAYEDIKGPRSLKIRYLYEDIPMGLVALASIGKLLNISVENIELVIKLGENLVNEDFVNSGRNLKNLGLEGMNAEEIIEYAETGNKC